MESGTGWGEIAAGAGVRDAKRQTKAEGESRAPQGERREPERGAAPSGWDAGRQEGARPLSPGIAGGRPAPARPRFKGCPGGRGRTPHGLIWPDPGSES